MRVAFTPEAEGDLVDIYLYLDDQSPEAARLMIGKSGRGASRLLIIHDAVSC
jgi:hypothetical protein